MVDIPLRLWNRPHWELSGRADVAAFFRGLGRAFPAATAVFVEGACIAADVEKFFRSAGQPGPYLPARQTLWPPSKQFCLPVDDETMRALAALAAAHAGPEVLDHLFVYAGAQPLAEYPDAFCGNSVLFVSSQVAEEQIRWFADELGLKAARVEPG